MHAITYRAFGPAHDVLTYGEVPTPAPAKGEVLVRLHISGVNPSDVKARAGSRPGVTKPPFPQIVPHSDGAGVIEAVGAGVDAARVGERVWIWNGQWQRAFGTAAEYIALPADQAVALPDAVSFEVGATLGIPALTACHAVFGSGDVAGKTLLISGGAGTVGHQAVQLAKWGGAKVIATASPANFARVRAAGADHVFDYRASDLADQLLAANGGQGIDRAAELEIGLNINTLIAAMAVNSHIAAYGSALKPAFELAFMPLMFKAVTLEAVLVYLLPWPKRAAAVERIHAALTAGALRPEIQATFPLADCAAAHAAVEAGHREGAILLKTG